MKTKRPRDSESIQFRTTAKQHKQKSLCILCEYINSCRHINKTKQKMQRPVLKGFRFTFFITA